MIPSSRRRALLRPALLFVALLDTLPARARAGESERWTNAAALEAQGGAPDLAPVEIGIDTVLRAEHTEPLGFAEASLGPGGDDHGLVPRVRPSITVTPGAWLTGKVEAQWYASSVGEESEPPSIYQAFAEARLLNGTTSLKVGRQELVFGSAFVLGADTFFDGSSFDAISLGARRGGGFSVDLFAGRYVGANSGGIEGEIYGSYGAYAVADGLAIELYGILDTGGEESVQHETWSLGTRLVANLGTMLAVEVEPVLQLGRRSGPANESIGAFGFHADATFTPVLGRRGATFSLSYAYGSGDGDPADGKFREFRNPNNDTALVGDMGLFGDLSGLTVRDARGDEVRASGLHVLTAGAGIDLIPRLNVFVDAHHFVASKAPADFSEDVGRELNLTVTHGCTERVLVVASVSRFSAGDFFEDAGAPRESKNYGYVQLQSTF